MPKSQKVVHMRNLWPFDRQNWSGALDYISWNRFKVYNLILDMENKEQGKSRNWFGTLNNPDAEASDLLALMH